MRENTCRYGPFPLSCPGAPEYAAAVTTVQRPTTPGGSGSTRFLDRLSSLVLKPPGPAQRERNGDGPRSVEELERSARSADDKERLVGLLAAPFAAAIALLLYGALSANDPPAYLKDGLANSKHVSLSLYADLLGVLLILALAMLATAWLRKRLLLGCAMALYGLAVFNLRYWGFGVPYVLFGAWLIVRAYRAQRDLREATGTGAAPGGGRDRGAGVGPPRAVTPARSKRYTPPGTTRRGGARLGAGERESVAEGRLP